MQKNIIQEKLFSFRETDYADFIAKLIPNISREKILGVRVLHIRDLAKFLQKKENISFKENFLTNLPHQYHEENLLHAFLLSYEKNEEIFLKNLENFLPFIDNWSVSDSLKNDIFKKKPEKIFEKILIWIENSEEYTVRLGIFFAMKYALGVHFQKNIFKKIVNISTEKYYINMMIAWFLAEAIVTNENEVLEVLKSQKLSKFVQNKAIQKMRESRKISNEMKDFLKNLKK